MTPGTLTSLQSAALPEHTVGEGMLLFLAISIGVLLVFALSFAIAVVLLRFRNERKAVKWHRLEQKWDDAILRALDGETEPTAFGTLVAPDEEVFCVNYLLRYARWIKGLERDRLIELAQPYLHHIVPRAQARDAQRRARAVQTLGELGVAAHPDVVVRALDDPSPLVAMVAARALARREHPQHLGPVLAHLHRFTTWSPNFLASMLASMGPAAAPALRAELTNPQHPPSVRAVLATALSYLYDYDAANIGVRVLEAEQDREVVAATLRLMGRVGREEHLPLIRRFALSEDFVVRAAAASTLGAMGREEDLVLLREACQDDSRWVALHAARALRDAGDIDSLQELAASGQARATLALQVLAEAED